MASALVVAAGGVGDLVRITPLVSVCDALGYDVDMLIDSDFDGAGDLFGDARAVRRVFSRSDSSTHAGTVDRTGPVATMYDVAILGAMASRSRQAIRAGRILEFDRSRWLREGDCACVAAIARQLGWQGSLPPAFVVPSSRVFDLPPGTVALHPGCKANWPWKKWHGFDALAASFPSVVIVGTTADLENRRTYFARPFTWPTHARSFVGALTLADTAALLSECAALVANDSGLMHVAAALGVPTFGVFGITSPAREAMPVPNMVAVTKGLPCEPACRRGPWGRRDCDLHLECLRTLTPDEVLGRMRRELPELLWTTSN
jgi:Glycosyltransferase family 9 (heptosyltransferase)